MGKRICVFGSSIGYGHNDDEGGGWCDRLKAYYFKSKKDVSIYNLSVSGAMSEDVVERFDVEYGARRPEVVLIAIGLNDSIFDKDTDDHKVSLLDTKQNIEQLVLMTRKNNSTIMFIGLTSVNEALVTPVPWATNLLYNNEDIKKYDDVIKKIASDNDAPYCYMYDLLQNEDLDDGLHPNVQGHKKMFKRIKDFLEQNNIT